MDDILFSSNETNYLPVFAACLQVINRYDTAIENLARAHELTVNETRLLLRLSLMPNGSTQKDLTQTDLRMSLASISRSVEALRRKGYLRTSANAADRRSQFISFTPEGDALARHVFQTANRSLALVIKKVSEDPDGDLTCTLASSERGPSSP